MNSSLEAFLSKYRGAEFPHAAELFDLLEREQAELVLDPFQGTSAPLCSLQARIYRQRASTVGEYHGEKDSELYREMLEIAAAMEATPNEHCNIWVFKSADSVTYHIFERAESSTIAFCFKRPGPAIQVKSS